VRLVFSSEARYGPDESIDGVIADVVDDARRTEGVPVCDVLFVEIWMVLGVVVQVVAYAGTDLCGICFFEGDGEMVWHLVLSRHSATGWLLSSPPPPSRRYSPSRLIADT